MLFVLKALNNLYNVIASKGIPWENPDVLLSGCGNLSLFDRLLPRKILLRDRREKLPALADKLAMTPSSFIQRLLFFYISILFLHYITKKVHTKKILLKTNI
ncbi:MAG: hypothetical protein D8M61_14690 [Ignavibacteriae bacterium]|nr:hypothetical protein [Ignavibacteriota bacterium]